MESNLSLIDLKQKNVLIVGDDYVGQNINFQQLDIRLKPKTFNIISSEFANLDDSIQLAQSYLKQSTNVDVVLIFPFLWEFIYMEKKRDEKYLGLKADPISHSDILTKKVKTITEEWYSQYPNIIVCWCLPYTPNFLKFNSKGLPGRMISLEFYWSIQRLTKYLKEYPNICILELNECYFLGNTHLETSSFNSHSSKLLFPNCTIDGLVPSFKFNTNFLKVFLARIYPLIEPDKARNVRPGTSNTNLPFANPVPENDNFNRFDYEDNRQYLSSLNLNSNPAVSCPPPPSWHYNEEESFKKKIVIDYQHSTANSDPNIKSNLPQYNSNSIPVSNNSQNHYQPQSQWDDPQQYNQQKNPLSVKEIWNLYDQQRDSRLSYSQSNSSNQYPNHHTSDRGSLYDPNSNYRHDYQAPSVPRIPMYSSTTSAQDFPQALNPNKGMGMSEFLQGNKVNPLPSELSQGSNVNALPSQLSQGSNVNPMPSQLPIKPVLPNLTTNIIDTLQDALKFLKDSKKGPSLEEEIKPCVYRKQLSGFFNSNRWTDLFLMGDMCVALDSLNECVKALNTGSPGKGLKIIMVTSCQKFIGAAEKALSGLVERNVIGLNDNIPFGAPTVLVDLPSNLRLRLSQAKFSSLSDLSAVLVYGDTLLANKTPANMEFVYLVKYILSKRKEECLNKVVVSESGSTEAEIVAQNAFNTTFLVPKKDVITIEDDKREGSSSNGKSSIGEFLNEKFNEDSTFKEHSDKRENWDKFNKDEEDMGKRWRNSSQEPVGTPVAPEKSVPESPKSARTKHPSSQKEESKLEMVFKVARVPLTEDEKKEYEDHDKEFAGFLEVVGRTVENQYLKEGRSSLIEHDSNYKTYAEVPDLHPDYEDKYAIFVARFEEVYGKEYNPQHLQTTWKHFWDVMINSLKEKDWKEKKKNLQLTFKMTYAMKHKGILAVRERKKARKLESAKRRAAAREEREAVKAVVKKKGDNSDEIIFIADVKKDSPSEAGKKREQMVEQRADLSKRMKTQSGPVSSSTLKTSVVKEVAKSTKKSSREDSPQKMMGFEELKKLYIETLSSQQNSRQSKSKPDMCPPIQIDDQVDPVEKRNIKWPSKPSDQSKPKIVINLSIPQKKKEKEVKYSLKETLHYLKIVSSSIGMMGPALESVVDNAKSCLPDTYSAYKVFDDDDSKLLVNIAINKMKTLVTTCQSSEVATYRTAISLTQTLLEEYKKALKNPPPKPSSSGSQSSRVDMDAIAKATTGYDTESTFKFIRNTYLYKGLSEPTKEELDYVFKEVSSIHFRMALAS